MVRRAEDLSLRLVSDIRNVCTWMILGAFIYAVLLPYLDWCPRVRRDRQRPFMDHHATAFVRSFELTFEARMEVRAASLQPQTHHAHSRSWYL